MKTISLESIEQLEGYNELNEQNKTRLNIFMDVNDLYPFIEYEVLENEQIKVLNLKHDKSELEVATAISNDGVFDDASIDLMFECIELKI